MQPAVPPVEKSMVLTFLDAGGFYPLVLIALAVMLTLWGLVNLAAVRNRLALAVDGRLETGATITAADLLVGGGADPDATTHAQRLVGRTVRPDSGGIVTADGGWHAPYVADHRGRP